MADRIYLEGNTFPVKDQLKALGCRFDGDRKAWYATTREMADAAAKVIKEGVGAQTAAPRQGRRPHFTKCQVCGVKADRYTKIYGSGECGDCYEERKNGY